MGDRPLEECKWAARASTTAQRHSAHCRRPWRPSLGAGWLAAGVVVGGGEGEGRGAVVDVVVDDDNERSVQKANRLPFVARMCSSGSRVPAGGAVWRAVRTYPPYFIIYGVCGPEC